MPADTLLGVIGLTGVLVAVLIDLVSLGLAIVARRLLVDADISYRPRLLRCELSWKHQPTSSRRLPRVSAELSEAEPILVELE